MAGQWRSVQGQRLLEARVSVKNIGASIVRLIQRGSGLRISELVLPVPNETNHVAAWNSLRVFPLLVEHQWIEPGETVTEDMLVNLRVPEDLPVLFETRLVWSWRDGEDNVVVFARQVVPADATLA